MSGAEHHHSLADETVGSKYYYLYPLLDSGRIAGREIVNAANDAAAIRDARVALLMLGKTAGELWELGRFVATVHLAELGTSVRAA
jgi:hypothetical protein